MSAFNTSIVFHDPVPSDIEISQSISPLPIEKVAEAAGLHKDEIFSYGPTKCKVSLDVRKRFMNEPNGNYVVVTGINPTP
jgi:formyltetrahydrofolate synthetase